MKSKIAVLLSLFYVIITPSIFAMKNFNGVTPDQFSTPPQVSRQINNYNGGQRRAYSDINTLIDDEDGMDTSDDSFFCNEEINDFNASYRNKFKYQINVFNDSMDIGDDFNVSHNDGNNVLKFIDEAPLTEKPFFPHMFIQKKKSSKKNAFGRSIDSVREMILANRIHFSNKYGRKGKSSFTVYEDTEKEMRETMKRQIVSNKKVNRKNNKENRGPLEGIPNNNTYLTSLGYDRF